MLRAVSLFIVCTLFFASNVLAERTSTQITPENIDEHPFHFKIEVTDKFHERREMRFQVTVTPKPEAAVSKGSTLNGSLHIAKGESLIAACDLEAKRTKAALVYSFLINAKYTKKSTFVFGETVSEEAGGRYFWFVLKDFAK